MAYEGNKQGKGEFNLLSVSYVVILEDNCLSPFDIKVGKFVLKNSPSFLQLMNALFTTFQNSLNVASISEQTHMAIFTFSMKLLPIRQSS